MSGFMNSVGDDLAPTDVSLEQDAPSLVYKFIPREEGGETLAAGVGLDLDVFGEASGSEETVVGDNASSNLDSSSVTRLLEGEKGKDKEKKIPKYPSVAFVKEKSFYCCRCSVPALGSSLYRNCDACTTGFIISSLSDPHFPVLSETTQQRVAVLRQIPTVCDDYYRIDAHIDILMVAQETESSVDQVSEFVSTFDFFDVKGALAAGTKTLVGLKDSVFESRDAFKKGWVNFSSKISASIKTEAIEQGLAIAKAAAVEIADETVENIEEKIKSGKIALNEYWNTFTSFLTEHWKDIVIASLASLATVLGVAWTSRELWLSYGKKKEGTDGDVVTTILHFLAGLSSTLAGVATLIGVSSSVHNALVGRTVSAVRQASSALHDLYDKKSAKERYDKNCFRINSIHCSLLDAASSDVSKLQNELDCILVENARLQKFMVGDVGFTDFVSVLIDTLKTELMNISVVQWIFFGVIIAVSVCTFFGVGYAMGHFSVDSVVSKVKRIAGSNPKQPECLHIQPCPLPIDANKVCNTSCGGHHCTHWSGCKPKSEGTHVIGEFSEDLGTITYIEIDTISQMLDDIKGSVLDHMSKEEDPFDLLEILGETDGVLSSCLFWSDNLLRIRVPDEFDEEITSLLAECVQLVEPVDPFEANTRFLFHPGKRGDRFDKLAFTLAGSVAAAASAETYSRFGRFAVEARKTKGANMKAAQQKRAQRLNDEDRAAARHAMRLIKSDYDGVMERMQDILMYGSQTPKYNELYRDLYDQAEKLRDDLISYYKLLGNAASVNKAAKKISNTFKGGRAGAKRRARNYARRTEGDQAESADAVDPDPVKRGGLILHTCSQRGCGLADRANCKHEPKCFTPVGEAECVLCAVFETAKTVAESVVNTPVVVADKPTIKINPPEAVKTSDVKKYFGTCPTCNLKHTVGNLCNKCHKVHCFTKQNPRGVDKCSEWEKFDQPKVASKECVTPVKPIPINMSNNIMSVFSDRTKNPVVSNAWKTKYNNQTYLCCCTHQLPASAYVKHGNAEYTLPKNDASFLHPFLEKDIILIPWADFTTANGSKCPNVSPVTIRVGFQETDKSVTFVGRDPISGSFIQSGIGSYTIKSGKVFHDVSTSNGSCGSGYFLATEGGIFLVAIHAGTVGSSNVKPNYGYIFEQAKN